MIDEIKKCVDARINFFDEYYTIPEDMQGEVGAFIQETTSLGNSCNSAAEFEEKFVATGLSDRFNAILPKCTPKRVKMTKEQKQHSKKVAKEILTENKQELIIDTVLDDVATTVRVEAMDQITTKNRERMIEDGTFDDYTITRNYIEDGGRLARFLKDKFKKK